MNGLELLISAFAVVASGLVAGVLLTFSDFAMRALAAESPAVGMAAMQSINRTVYRSVFLMLFVAMALIATVLAGHALIAAPAAAVFWLLAGSAAYLLGVFAVTLVCNVPMNKALDAMPAGTSEAALYWKNYSKSWTRWNHVRTVAAITATVCFLVASLVLARAG